MAEFQPPTIPDFIRNPEVNVGPDLRPQLAQIYDGGYEFLRDFDYQSLASNLKILALILSVIFTVVIVVVVYKMRGLIKKKVEQVKTEFSPPEEAKTAYDARWQEIKNHVNSFKESDWKLAVIEADKFVDDVLKTAGFAGETMGERLMLIEPGQILNLQNLWDAHKLRNLIVHDAHYQVTHRQAILAIEAFESVLRELSALT